MSEASRSGAAPTCYRHAERESYIRCQRCDRYVCPDCSRDASVGVHCLDCFRSGTKGVPRARTRFGGVVHAKTDVLTLTLIGVNAAVFVGYLAFGQALGREMALVGGGGGFRGVATGEFWRLLTSAFFHTQFWHIGINMLSLWILGRPLEQLLGRLRFAGLYLAAGLAGSAVAYAFTAPTTWILGASGAIFGLFGAVVVLLRRMRADITWIGVILAINVVLNVVFWQALSWQAHLGGFVAGLVLGAAFAYAPRQNRLIWHVAGFVLVAVIALALVIGRTVTLSGVPGPM